MKTIKQIMAGYHLYITMCRRTFAIVVLVFMFCSCEQYLDIDLPSSQLTAEAVYEDAGTANAALMDVYANVRGTGMFSGTASGISAEMGLYADEFQYYGTPTYFAVNFYNNSLIASNSQTASWWSSAYAQVYAANAVIEGVAASVSLPAQVRDRLSGEALFLRALLHFYLENLYGNIPYITTTNYQVNNTVSRMPTAEVYSLIINDLENAVLLLPEEYPAQGRIRATKQVARALLARVYLYKGDWAGAADMASALINDQVQYSLPSPEVSYLKDTPAAIWQFMPAADGENTEEGASFIFEQGPPSFAALTEGFITAFEPGDLRRAAWVREVSGDNSSWFHPYKYKERFNTGVSVEYPIILGLAEQYLIRAEARAMQGDLIGASEDLDVIRLRAGLSPNTANSQQGLLDAVLQERRMELFSEYGHRFFDLKRTSRLDAVLTGTKPGWQATDGHLPVPETQLIINPNLAPQNPGY
jgi:hypothetical protein